jgi:hypothetical protein
MGVLPILETRRCAAFDLGVKSVFGVGAEKEMIGVDAVANVAAMADAEAFGDGAVSEFIGESVNQDPLAVDLRAAIARVIRLASPEPAARFGGLINILPEIVDTGLLGNTATDITAIVAARRSAKPRLALNLFTADSATSDHLASVCIHKLHGL